MRAAIVLALFTGWLDGRPLSFELRDSRRALASSVKPVATLLSTSTRFQGGGAGGGEWWDASWANRREITLDNRGAAGPLTEFPVLVTLDAASFDYSRTQPDGADLRFLDADHTTLLPYEIEHWDPTGVSRLWVRVPQLDAADTDAIWLYYNNPAAPDGAIPAAVWDADFVNVWHLADAAASPTVQDSTATALAGTVLAPTGATPAPGLSAGGLAFDGTSDAVTAADHDGLTPGSTGFTVSGWFHVAALPPAAIGHRMWLFQKGAPGQYEWGLAINDYDRSFGKWTLQLFPADGSVERMRPSGSSAVPGVWTYVAATVANATATPDLYINGALDNGPALVNAFPVGNGAAALNVGRRNASLEHLFQGSADEIRVSRTARSADWVRAEYLAMTGALATLGAEEGVGAPPPPSGPPPVATMVTPLAGSVYSAGDTIFYSGLGTDGAGSPLAASQLSWTVVFHHDSHTHPFLGPITGVDTGTFDVPATGEASVNTWYRLHLTVTDGSGVSSETTRDIFPRTATLTLSTNIAGLDLMLDGQTSVGPISVDGVVGFTRTIGAPSPQLVGGHVYEFVSWSDGGAQTHAITTPEPATTFVATYRETLPSAGEWWNSDWRERREITLDNRGAAGPLTEFPVLVTLDAASFDYSRTQPDGADLRFLDADHTTLLPYEIEHWDPTGVSRLWVRVPQLDAADTDAIWLYYNNPAAPAGATPAAVWDADFVNVWHLADAAASPTVQDSTATALAGTVLAPTGATPAPGLSAGGLAFNGTSDAVTAADHDGLTPGPTGFTVSGWFHVAELPPASMGHRMWLFQKGAPGQYEWGLAINDYDRSFGKWTLQLFPADGSVERMRPSGSSAVPGVWTYVAATMASATATPDLYINGALDNGPSLVTAFAVSNGTAALNVGRRNASLEHLFQGSADEIRVSRTARSADWIRAEYLAMTGGLVTLGPAELPSGPPPPAPTATILTPTEGTIYNAGSTISYSGSGTDADGNPLAASQLSWTVVFHHDSHTHPVLGPITGVDAGTFDVPATGEASVNTWYRLHLAVTDGNGVSSETTRDIFPRTATLTLSTNIAGLGLTLDGQISVGPIFVDGVAGFARTIGAPSPQLVAGRLYEFVSWSDSGAQTHAITTPESATVYLATYREASSSAATWWSAGWRDRREITLDNRGAAGPLTNFPVLVTLDAASFDYSRTKADGADLRFLDADHITLLPYEIEHWDPTGVSRLWVRVPQLDAADTDAIWLYYNNPVAPAGATPAAVWDADFVNVWHLTDAAASPSVHDSTATALAGTVLAPTGATPADGLSAGGLAFNGTSDALTAADHDGLTPGPTGFTVSGWFHVAELPPASMGHRMWLFQKGAPGQYEWGLAINDYDRSFGKWTLQLFPSSGSGERLRPSGSTVVPGTWTYVAATVADAAATPDLYVNGALDNGPPLVNAFAVVNGTAALNVGRRSDNLEHFFQGSADEIRLSRTARSADWIRAEYLAMTGGLVTLGSVETIEGAFILTPPTVIAATPAEGSVGVATGAVVTATFSAPMQEARITTATFLLRDGSSAPVPASVSYDASTQTARLTPTAPLTESTTYTATIRGGLGGVADSLGNLMTSDVVWSFTTAAPVGSGTGGGGDSVLNRAHSLAQGMVGLWHFDNTMNPVNLIYPGDPNLSPGFTGTPTFETTPGGWGFVSSATAFLGVNDGGSGGLYDFTTGPFTVQVDYLFRVPPKVTVAVSRDLFRVAGWVVTVTNSDGGSGFYRWGMQWSRPGIEKEFMAYQLVPNTFVRTTAVIKPGEAPALYVNGSADAPGGQWGDAWDTPSSYGGLLRIGQDTTGNVLGMPVTRVVLWNRALTPSEVLEVGYGNPFAYMAPQGGSGMAVLTPNGGETLTVGSSEIIRWTATGGAVTLDYRTSPGGAWLPIAASVPAAEGRFTWTVPSTVTTTARIRVSDASNAAIADTSDGDFTIVSASPTPPTVTAVSPTNGAAGVATSASATATFSKAMAPATFTAARFFLKDATNVAVPASVTYDGATQTVRLQPTAALAHSTMYTATVKGGAGGVTDVFGNALANDVVWSFTTVPDTTPPTVTSLLPATGSADVSLATVVTAVFSEAMAASSITASTTLLKDAAGLTVPATVTYTALTRTAQLQPTSALAGSTTYTVTVKGGPSGVKDAAGNALTSDATSVFTTAAGATPPVTLTVTANIAGLSVSVDGTPAAAPIDVTAAVGSAHILSAPSPQTVAGNTYTFVAWSDTGAATHTVTTPAADTTYVATYQDVAAPPPVALTVTTNIAGLSLTFDGVPVAAPLVTDAVVGSPHTLEAPLTQIVGGRTYQFVSWSDAGAGTHAITTPAADTTYTATYEDVTPTPTWLNLDIGTPTPAGSTTIAGDLFTVAGAGADIWNAADAFQFVYLPLSGDGEIVARVASLENTNGWAKAGVMIRESLTAGSRYAALLVSATNGLAFQRRLATGGPSTFTPASGGAPTWVKLTRTGDLFSAYSSSNGTTWSLVGTDSFAAGSDLSIGLAVTSHNDGLLTTATFDGVAVTAGP